MKKKILIAEDNDLNLKLMSDLLNTKGYDVFAVKDGESALNELRNSSYNLLLLDLQMPILSGFEVLESIKKNGIKICVVVVSACAMADEIEKARDLGCLDFITKPIRINEFLEVVKRYCA